MQKIFPHLFVNTVSKLFPENPDQGKRLAASKIPEHFLENIMRIIEARSPEVREKWIAFFGEASYYC